MSKRSGSKFSDCIIKYDRLSRTKKVIKFYRNNLSFDMAQKTDDGFLVLNDKACYNGCCVNTKIIFKTETFSNAVFKSKAAKLKGYYKNFTVFARIDIDRFPGRVTKSNKYVKCCFEFSGDLNKLLKPNLKKNHNQNSFGVCRDVLKTPAHIPSYIKSNAMHPYSGGGCSSK